MLLETKLCSKCDATKPVDQFSPRGKDRTDYQAWCKPCMAQYSTKQAADKVRQRRGLPLDHPKMQGYRDQRPTGYTFLHKGKGYIYVKAPGHHRADRYGWVLQHILVVEAKYGILVTRAFTVHHLNGDRADNRPENLELRFGNHGKGANVLPGLLRDPAMRKIARAVLAQYDD